MHYIRALYDPLVRFVIGEAAQTNAGPLRLTAKLNHDFFVCLKIMHATSYLELIEIESKYKADNLDNLDPHHTQKAINTSLKRVLELIKESTSDVDYSQDQSTSLRFQEALLCLIAGHLGNKNPAISIDAIKKNEVYAYAKRNNWLNTTPNTPEERGNILQSIMVAIVNYHHDFTNLPQEVDQKLITALLSQASDAFSPNIQLPFPKKVALAILAYISKKPPTDLITTIHKFDTLNEQESILNYLCCCISTQYLNKFTQPTPNTPSSTLQDRLAKLFSNIAFATVTAVVSILVISAGIGSFVMYMSCNISLVALAIYFATISTSAVLAEAICLHYMYKYIRQDLNDFQQDFKSEKPKNNIATKPANNEMPPSYQENSQSSQRLH